MIQLKMKLSVVLKWLVSALGLVMLFQNCKVDNSYQEVQLQSITENQSNSPISDSVPQQRKPAALSKPLLLDNKQILESMMSLTGLKASEVTIKELSDEINFRRNLLGSKKELSKINAPSIIATTSLAGAVCRQLLKKESTVSKDFYKDVDFTKGLNLNPKSVMKNVYTNMASRFWMRTFTSDEQSIIDETIDEFYSNLDISALTRSQETYNLSLFICTSMLSLPETYIY